MSGKHRTEMISLTSEYYLQFDPYKFWEGGGEGGESSGDWGGREDKMKVTDIFSDCQTSLEDHHSLCLLRASWYNSAKCLCL